jgi:hypothetical protein
MSDIELLKWREGQVRAREDRALAERFAARALEVREEVEFLLAGGLTEGAEVALGAFAEEDLVDFSIMVDLAASVPIEGVPPLAVAARRQLAEFLDRNPWHLLAIDLDVTVVLGMADDVLCNRARWYEISPELPVTLAGLMDRVDREQLARFAAELEARIEAHPEADEAAVGMIRELVAVGAKRLGVRPRPA